ncbi:MAG: hypothetical protein A2Y94_12030 [Caldithrix sp. RBG_13_44_9]|nr:MAG: hypothetical protein A2Y94_12030 [Caldithrix sp. RBG_13_44_9]
MYSYRLNNFLSGLVFGILLILFNENPVNPAKVADFYATNQLYKTGQYQAALDSFYRLLKLQPGLLQKEPLLRFKIGYSYFKLGNFNESLKVFESSSKDLEIIQDYLLYFQAVSHLQLKDTLSFTSKIKAIRREYPGSPLIPLVDSINARFAMHQQLADSAIYYLNAISKSGYFDRDDIYLDLLDMQRLKKDTVEYRRLTFLFLDKYPFHDRSESIYQELLITYFQKIPIRDLKKLLEYLFETSQFLAAGQLLELQSPWAEGLYEQEYFRWMPVEILFRQGEYQTVLQWCQTDRSKFKSLSILRDMDLNIARCYLRLDNTAQSIKHYLEFQKRYPRDALSPEVLWKVAWLYEEKENITAAIQMYRNLVNIYPRYEFYHEAYFRIGLNYFRLKKFQQARLAWEEALQRVSDSSQKDRIRYWIGKCFEMEKNYKKQGEIYIQLAERPIDTFYNLKAFYLTSNGSDTHQKIHEIFWELHENQQSYLAAYITKFKKALFVEEILGPRWGDRELRSITESSAEWQELFSLGELYEKMENYGFAYRRFRNIYDRHFANSALTEMIPIFKKLYPLYFAEQVDSAATKFAIPQELIWSVIKKESAFESKVISYANAYGLMQLLPGTASQVAPQVGIPFNSTEQLFDPEINIEMGTYYLSSLLLRYDNNYVMALAGYNAGPHRVDRWKKTYDTADDDLFMENLEFEQTRAYVRTCLKFFWIYRAITHPGEIPPEIINYPVKVTDFL